jgi:hypothetical protein
MPKTPAPDRAGAELDEELLDAILAGQHLPEDAPEQAHVVAEMLSTLAGPADPADLAAEPAVRLAFARAIPLAAGAGAGIPPDGAQPGAAAGARGRAHPRRPGRRHSSWRPLRLSAWLATTLTAVLVMLGGTVAAYAGVLPAPIQNLAHRAIGAPAARTHPIAQALCRAYGQAEARHDAQGLEQAYTQLARAAGGASHVIPYCIAAGEPAALTPRSGSRPGSPGTSPTTPPGRGKSGTKGHQGHHKSKGKHKAKGKSKPKKPKKPKKAKKAKKAKHHKKPKKHHKHHGKAKGHHKHKKPKKHKKAKKHKQ